MTPVDIPAIQAGLISHALGLGLFSDVSGHEPKAAPIGGVHGALWVDEIGPARARSGLTSTTIRLGFNFRVGANMLDEPQDDIDVKVLVAASALMSAYSNDFELGGQVMEIDLLGAHGIPLSAKAGYLNQDSKLYRVMVITIPLIVNDVFAQNP